MLRSLVMAALLATCAVARADIRDLGELTSAFAPADGDPARPHIAGNIVTWDDRGVGRAVRLASPTATPQGPQFTLANGPASGTVDLGSAVALVTANGAVAVDFLAREETVVPVPGSSADPGTTPALLYDGKTILAAWIQAGTVMGAKFDRSAAAAAPTAFPISAPGAIAELAGSCGEDTCFLAWRDGSQVWGLARNAAGTQWPVQLVGSGAVGHLAVAQADGEDRALVAWAASDGSLTAVFASSSNAGAPFVIAKPTGTASAPKIAWDSWLWYVAWADEANGGRVALARVGSLGTLQFPLADVVTDGAPADPDLTTRLLVWVRTSAPREVMGCALNSAAQCDAPPTVLSTVPAIRRAPALTFANGGWAAWTESADGVPSRVRLSSLGNRAAPVASAAVTLGPQDAPALAAAGPETMLAWRETADSRSAIFAANTANLTHPTQVAAGGVSEPAFVGLGNTAYLAWADPTRVLVLPISDPTHPAAAMPVVVADDSQRAPAHARLALDAGGPVVAWVAHGATDDLLLARLDPAGNPRRAAPMAVAKGLPPVQELALASDGETLWLAALVKDADEAVLLRIAPGDAVTKLEARVGADAKGLALAWDGLRIVATWTASNGLLASGRVDADGLGRVSGSTVPAADRVALATGGQQRLTALVPVPAEGGGTALHFAAVAFPPVVTVNPPALDVPKNTTVTAKIEVKDAGPNPILSILRHSRPDARLTIEGTVLSYTPPNNMIGADSFIVAASDGADSGQATVQVNVHAASGPVVAHDGSVRMLAGETKTIDVQVDNPGAVSFSMEIAKQPARGKLMQLGLTRFLYTAPSDFCGEDLFRYAVTDPQKHRSVATIKLEIEPGPLMPCKYTNCSCGPGDAGALMLLALFLRRRRASMSA